MKKCPICESSNTKFVNDLYDDRYGYPGVYKLLQCNNCNHKYLDVDFTDQQITDLYTNFYPRTERSIDSFQPLEYTKGIRGWWSGDYRAFAAVPENVRVLDIGCGFGESLAYHKKRGCEVYGVDADANLQRVADKYQFNVKIGSFDAKNYSENFFDYVTMDQVIEHFANPAEVLKGINHILKPGGFLVFTTPNSNGFSAKWNQKKWINWHTPYHLQHFSRKSFKILGRNAGFKLVSLKCVTSSEWARYQQIHNIIFPDQAGKKAAFWSTGIEITESQQKRLNKVNRFHKTRMNHLLTRLFDAIGLGDNFIGIYQKV
ncbi:class I SAM-dependent methyltransferase [Leptospira ognonensis]|uniref:Class I SAM-dependent methyltransferase n=1 Tax=Leptospira ognonensis TaxID=2484945 RepID=A0A4R9JYF2_9LEPT|nr:class I SAM-dependent methyltransferase [Leptospira ognonensis]TGL56537.1 class I SAM-dependent methyltransferase [Leptospira ognonensis]